MVVGEGAKACGEENFAWHLCEILTGVIRVSLGLDERSVHG